MPVMKRLLILTMLSVLAAAASGCTSTNYCQPAPSCCEPACGAPIVTPAPGMYGPTPAMIVPGPA